MDELTEFTVSESGIPKGSYPAIFQGIETYRGNVEEYGEAIVLKFRIVSGDREGEEAWRFCSKKFTARSNLYKFAKSLIGRDLQRGDRFDFKDLIGTRGTILVEETDKGSTRVESFHRAAD